MTSENQDRPVEKHKVKIVVVDDHPIVRQGLADLINQEQDLTVCGQAEDAPQAMEVIKTLGPDLVIVDIVLQESSGVELIKDIKLKYPNVNILALSMYEESLYAERIIRAGAMGYIMKREATEKVVAAIRKVLDGQLYLSDKMTAKVLSTLINGKLQPKASPITRLSDRELEVFTLLGQGKGTRQIANQLHLSIKTIETYRAHIKDKLKLKGSSELLQHAFQWVTDQGGS